MKIGIHLCRGSFSDHWVSYCLKNDINFKLVNCYSTNIIHQLEDCNALMWHHHHENYKDVLFAKQLIYSLEQCGKKIFPDYKTCWHFDDKVGQKYLFESIGAPLVPSHVFYSKEEAYNWIENATFPKVLKLRGGAGSRNVRLVNSSSHARILVKRAFGRGFSQFDRTENLREHIRKYREGEGSILGVAKGLGRLFIPTEFAKMHGREKGYIYFQDFIPNCPYDIRVVVINGKAFGAKRIVRRNDFRASGSENLFYEKDHVPIDTVILAFKLACKLHMQCAAFDFVFNEEGKPFVLEVSFGFPPKAAEHCIGYWDKSLQFHEGKFYPQEWMVEALLNE